MRLRSVIKHVLRPSSPRSSRFKYVREVVRQIALADSTDSFVDIVGYAHQLDARAGRIDRKRHVTRSPVSVLRPADTSGVDELHSANNALPWLVRVSEADDVSGSSTEIFRHLLEEDIGTVFGYINRV